MASPAHCAYCFETLSASLEKRQPLSLQQVELLWAKYEDSDVEDSLDQDTDITPDARQAGDEDMLDVPGEAQQSSYRPAAISRILIAPSPSSASSSSPASTTPSTPSLPNTASSATSKSSSRTSFFSLGRRSKQEANTTRGSYEEYPLFVTWNTISSRSGSRNLRGCIGTFEAQELDDGLRSYALTSAFDDSRFHPISLRELPSLECGVTLLTNFEPAANPMAWEIGKHGLRISFTYHGRRYGSTYLPDVAREQGWTKEETIISLMRKAGWSGRKEDWRKVDLSVITYEGARSQLDYREWREWRDWVKQQGVEA